MSQQTLMIRFAGVLLLAYTGGRPEQSPFPQIFACGPGTSPEGPQVILQGDDHTPNCLLLVGQLFHRFFVDDNLGRLVFYASLILFPLLIVIIPTFQTVRESSQGIMRLPENINLNNYISAWKQSSFHIALRNSLIITGSTIFLNILIGSIAAFPMAIREKNKVFKALFYLFLIGLMLPFQAIMIPLYILMGRTLRLTNTFTGTILVYLAMTLPITIFFFSQFIKTIPKEMEEASVMDGCGYLRMFYKIFFPMMKPINSA